MMASLMASLMDAKILIFMPVMEELRLDSLIILLNICFSVRRKIISKSKENFLKHQHHKSTFPPFNMNLRIISLVKNLKNKMNKMNNRYSFTRVILL